MLLTLLAFALALGLLVTFHEFGHYLVARLCGVRVLRFSVGFGSILLRRVDHHGTEWALSAIPLGGYVKMLDDAPAQADAATRRAAFNTQPLMRRVAVVLAGPAANLVLAVLLYAFLGFWGAQEPTALLAPPPPGTVAAQAGIPAGATLEAVDGVPVPSWTQARWRLLEPLTTGAEVTLALRIPSGEIRVIRLRLPANSPGPDQPDPLAAAGLVLAAAIPVVGPLAPGAAAQAAGLQPGDEIRSVGSLANPTTTQFVEQVQAHAGQVLPMTVLRHGALVSLTVTPQPEAAADGHTVGRIGALIQAQRPMILVRLGPIDSLQRGVERTVDVSLLTLRVLGRMVVGTASWRNVSGPVTIAEYAGQSARLGLEAYLGFLALISISIGILNLLPIPLLDGGHLLFYAIEAARGGRPLPARWRDFGFRLGLMAVIGLTLLALLNDLERLFS